MRRPEPAPMLAGVGGTGLAVAVIRAQESARPDRLFDDPLAAAFAELRPPGAGEPGGPHAAALRAWVVARTVFLDDLLISACAEGARQVVLLGAGFDARAFRLRWPDGVRCFELDTPDVLASKERVVAAHRARPRCARLLVPADLRGDWPAQLTAADFDPARPTVWIAEGLLVYLDPDQVDRLAATVTRLSAPASQLGLTFRHRASGAGGGSLGPALRRSAAPDDPVGWLAGHGWAATLSSPREVLAARGRAPRGPAPPGAPRALLASARLDKISPTDVS
jgi:methyltransferase (TIGR00027 family)